MFLSKGLTFKVFILAMSFTCAYFCYAKFYKLTQSGLQVDEAVHVRFAHDLSTALDRYPNFVFKAPEAHNRYLGTANHNANYVSIYFSRYLLDYFGIPKPVWYQRIPILIASMIFIIGLCMLIPKFFHSKALGFCVFVFLASNYAFFDLMILARGYGYQLACFILVIWSWLGLRSFLQSNYLNHYFLRYLIPSMLVAINVFSISFAIGALLTSVIVFGLTQHLLALFLWFEQKDNRFKKNIILIFTVISDIGIFWVARFIYYYKFHALMNIAKTVTPHDSSKIFFDEIINFYFVNPSQVVTSSSNLALITFLLVISIWGFVYHLELKRSDKLRPIPINPERAFLRKTMIALCISLTLVFAAAIDLLKKSVGESRHQPIFALLIAFGIFLSLDRIILHSGRINMKIKQVLIPCLMVILITFSYKLRFDPLVNQAYPGWDIQSATGLLLNQLKSIDPNRTWTIHVGGGHTHWNSYIVDYYREFGFNAFAVKRDEDPHDFQMCATMYTTDICHPQYPRFQEFFFKRFNLSIADKRK